MQHDSASKGRQKKNTLCLLTIGYRMEHHQTSELITGESAVEAAMLSRPRA